MKKYIFILSAILIFATILIVGCKKDNNKDEPIAGKPTLSLKSGAGLISTNTQAAFGDSLNFEITAKSNGSNNLDKFRIYLNDEVIIDSAISTNIFVYRYHPLKSSLENEVWKFVISDKAGNEAMVSVVITRILQIAGNPTLSLKSGTGLISANTEAAYGDTLNFEITANFNGTNNLDKFKIYMNDEVIVDSAISTNSFVYNCYTLKSSLENEVWKFVITDKVGNEGMDSVIITRIPQTIADEQTIQKYITAHNLTAQSTPSGLHYVIVEAGNSSHPTSTSTVTVNYKGYFTDGSIFDESVPGNPIIISLSSVIKGWQEGIQLFGKGGKGILLIPSALGYGSTANYGIPANSVLIFDVELIDFY